MAQIYILPKKERLGFESPPVYDKVEKKRYFTCNEAAEEYISTIRSETNKVGFILQYGVFLHKGS